MSFARVRALVVIGVLAVAAVVFVIVALVRDSQGGPVADGCPPGSVMANIALPVAQEVKIKVLNATDNQDWGSVISDDFKNRGFQTQKPANNKKRLDKVAILRYGPKAVGGAQLVRAYFLDNADTEYDAKRTSDVVDVVIGSGFQQLATPTEVNQSIVELGEAQLPPGACAAPKKAAAK